MIPTYQTIFGQGKGNCFAACVASILELPLEGMPNFVLEEEPLWIRRANEWLAKYNRALISMEWVYLGLLAPGTVCIFGGKTKDGNGHAVVYEVGKGTLFNPMPGAELELDTVQYIFLIHNLDPVLQENEEGEETPWKRDW